MKKADRKIYCSRDISKPDLCKKPSSATLVTSNPLNIDIPTHLLGANKFHDQRIWVGDYVECGLSTGFICILTRFSPSSHAAQASDGTSGPSQVAVDQAWNQERVLRAQRGLS